MQLFSFRNRTILRRIGLGLLIAALVCIVLAAAGLVYCQRYLVYTKDGVHLDFSRPNLQDEARALPPQEDEPPFTGAQIVEASPVQDAAALQEGARTGYEIPQELLSDPEALLAQLDSVEPCTLLLDAKDGLGRLFYASSITGQASGGSDALDTLVPELKKRGFYLCARVSAFRDRSFGLENVPCGLPLSSGALWMDSGGCYWLDPANDTVSARLTRIATELYGLGFDEVVFSDFYFPESDNIVYDAPEGRTAVLAAAAERLTAALDGAGVVSFELQEGQTPFSPGAGRLYMRTDDALMPAALGEAAAELLTDPESQLVFLTDSHDTRFAACGQLRPFAEEE